MLPKLYFDDENFKLWIRKDVLTEEFDGKIEDAAAHIVGAEKYWGRLTCPVCGQEEECTWISREAKKYSVSCSCKSIFSAMLIFRNITVKPFIGSDKVITINPEIMIPFEGFHIYEYYEADVELVPYQDTDDVLTQATDEGKNVKLLLKDGTEIAICPHRFGNYNTAIVGEDVYSREVMKSLSDIQYVYIL